MILTVLRSLFVLLMAAVGWFFARDSSHGLGLYAGALMAVAICVGVLLVVIDIFSPRKKLAIFGGVFCGLLVGMVMAYALSFVVQLLTDRYLPPPDATAPDAAHARAIHDGTISFADLMLGVSCCYLAISFILQTKDDFRFVIPYVEFSKQTKGARPILLDTSVLIDGRIAEIVNTGIIESQLIVPQFVLDELHQVADSADKSNRTRGRYGLDVLHKLQHTELIDVVLFNPPEPLRVTGSVGEVDQKLLVLAEQLNGRVLTNDFNLNKVAQARGVSVINLHALAGAVKPVVRVGDRMRIVIQKPGDLAGQGVGYLEDGTMVVVEQGRSHVHDEVELTVTNLRQTAAGRMIFGRMADGSVEPRPRPQPLPSAR